VPTSQKTHLFSVINVNQLIPFIISITAGKTQSFFFNVKSGGTYSDCLFQIPIPTTPFKRRVGLFCDWLRDVMWFKSNVLIGWNMKINFSAEKWCRNPWSTSILRVFIGENGRPSLVRNVVAVGKMQSFYVLPEMVCTCSNNLCAKKSSKIPRLLQR